MAKVELSSNVYFFDIETTTFGDPTSPSGQNVVVYLVCVIKADFQDLTRSIYDIPHEVQYFRTIHDLESYFDQERRQLEPGTKMLAYAHNASYEFNFMIREGTMIHDELNNEDGSFLFRNPHSPISFTGFNGSVIFRDSYQILRKSIKTLGEELSNADHDFLKKTEEKGGYSQQYFPFSDLPEVEYEYNKRDCEIAMMGIYQMLQLRDRPLSYLLKAYTSTSLLRIEDMDNAAITQKDGKNVANRAIAYYLRNKYYSREDYEADKKCYIGGDTHNSPMFSGEVYRDTINLDFKSDYPGQMLNRWIPDGGLWKVNEAWQRAHFLRSSRINAKVFGIDRSLSREDQAKALLDNCWESPRNFFCAAVKLKHLKAICYQNNIWDCLSLSKTDPIGTEGKDYIVDNGRILEAEEIVIYVHEYTWLTVQLSYTYDPDIEVIWLYEYARRHAPLAHIVNAINYHGRSKTLLKKWATTPDNAMSREELGDVVTDGIYESVMAMEPADRQDAIDALLMISKGNLNGEYGRMCEDPLKYVFMPSVSPEGVVEWKDPEEPDFEKYKQKRYEKKFFGFGSRISGAARFSLCVMAYAVNTIPGCHVVYWDTDSLKCIGSADAIMEVVNTYNDKCIPEWAENPFGFGKMEREEGYDYLIGWGAKKYMAITDNVIHPTIAGVPKRQISDCYNYLYNEERKKQGASFDPAEFLRKYFRPNVTYDHSVLGKLGAYYHDQTPAFNIEVQDENGKTGRIQGRSGVELVPVAYTLMDMNNRVNQLYVLNTDMIHHRRPQRPDITMVKNIELDDEGNEYYTYSVLSGRYGLWHYETPWYIR